MAQINKLFILSVCLYSLQACTTNIDPVPVDIPVDATSKAGQGMPAGASRLPSEDAAGNVNEMSRPAVLALLEQSQQEQQSGRLDLAIATIERALRMDSKSPVLWTRLAHLRLLQGNWQQAYVLANKSNSLSRNDVALQLENWRIIEMAKLRQGDAAAVEEARTQIRDLSDQL